VGRPGLLQWLRVTARSLGPLGGPARRQPLAPGPGPCSPLPVLGKLLGDGQENVVHIQRRLGAGLHEEQTVLFGVGRGLVILNWGPGDR